MLLRPGHHEFAQWEGDAEALQRTKMVSSRAAVGIDLRLYHEMPMTVGSSTASAEDGSKAGGLTRIHSSRTYDLPGKGSLGHHLEGDSGAHL